MLAVHMPNEGEVMYGYDGKYHYDVNSDNVEEVETPLIAFEKEDYSVNRSDELERFFPTIDLYNKFFPSPFLVLKS